MIRRCLRIGARLGALSGIVFALYKLAQSRRAAQDEDWFRYGPPAGAQPRAGAEAAAPEAAGAEAPVTAPAAEAPPVPATGWVEPDGTACPSTHPIKAKLSSGLYHLPGMVAYGRTRPDRCYADEAAAQADGLTRAKR